MDAVEVPWIDFLAEEEGIEHGTNAGYRWGCRCAKCKPLKKPRKHDPCFLKKVNGKNFHPNAPHGTTNGYNNYRCRCAECQHANKLASRKQERRNDNDSSQVQEG